MRKRMTVEDQQQYIEAAKGIEKAAHSLVDFTAAINGLDKDILYWYFSTYVDDFADVQPWAKMQKVKLE